MATATEPMSPVPSPIYIHSSSDVGSGRVQSVIKRKRHDDTAASSQLPNESKTFGCEERERYARVDKHPLAHNIIRTGDGGSTSTHYSDTGSSSDGDEEKSQLETSYLEPIHDPKPLLKRSKVHRVASMSQLPSHLSADQFLPENTMSVASMNQLVSGMNKSRSTPSLPSMIEGRADILSPSHLDQINPDNHLHSMLKSMGVATQTFAALDLKDYFIQTTAAHISAYGSDVLRAVRERDFSALRQMHLAGRTLQCCNNFGESILHMACRHGDLEIVRFLVNEAGVSFRVRDDFGRTPLHDAFWTQKPEIELVKFIVSSCPDLLLLKDKRGFTPLAYARRSHWGEWCEFLQENYNLLIPHEL